MKIGLFAWSLAVLFSINVFSQDESGLRPDPVHEKVAGEVDGVIKSVEKDHIIIQDVDLKDRKIMVPADVRIGMKFSGIPLSYDPVKKILRSIIPVSSLDGGKDNNDFAEIPIPAGELWLRNKFKKLADYQKGVNASSFTFSDAELSFQPLKARVPTPNDPTFIAPIVFGEDGLLKMTVENKPVELVLKKGCSLIGFALKDLKPFEYDVFVNGREAGGVLTASEILFVPVGDPFKRFDSKLPNVLVIGDSISLGYTPQLRLALKDKVNIHHPPLNCGSSTMGRAAMHRWVGACTVPGRQWDIITFNAAHWDRGSADDVYLRNMEAIIQILQKTKSKLIWVTATPIPYGFNLPGKPTGDTAKPVLPEKDWPSIEHEASKLVGSVPGRSRHVNELMAGLLKKYPEVEVCDLWQVVKNGEKGFYRDWWHSWNVHFFTHGSVPLGRALGKRILEVLGRPDEALNPMEVHGEWGKDVPEISSLKPEKTAEPAK